MELEDRIKRFLGYDPKTGIITWIRGGKGRSLGKVAGSIKKTKSGYTYRRIKFEGVEYSAARIAWVIQTGKLPDFIIDHINNNALDVSWNNLRRGDTGYVL